MSWYEETLFSYLNIAPFSSNEAIQHLEDMPAENWFFDSYRTAQMLPLYTEGGRTGKTGSLNMGQSTLAWTSFAHPHIREYIEKSLFPWMKPAGRIMILKTPPGQSSAPHIDCRAEDMDTHQPKLRIVLQGAVSSLYFITKMGKKRPPSDRVGVPFIMDGRWPHGMQNNATHNKYTLCIGTPWRGEGLGSCEPLLGDSPLKESDLQMPEDYAQFFEDLEKRKMKFREL